MLNKRILGVITVKNNIAVQSFGYNQYLPLGKPEILAKNLNRWGADEILINVIDQTFKKNGPDFELLKSIQSLNLSTPIVYGGGISSLDEAKKVITLGADRILVENILKKDLKDLRNISQELGSQSVILSIPVSMDSQDRIFQYNYIDKKKEKISNIFLKAIKEKLISEVLLIDYLNEGYKDKFNTKIINSFPCNNAPLICFGGIASSEKIKKIIKHKQVSAVAIGNSLNYQEISIQTIKEKLKKNFFRKPRYLKEI